MSRPKYSSGAEVRLGDVVDVGAGNGPRMRVVVIIPTHEAASGFDAAEWSYLGKGLMLQDQRAFGLLHLGELNDEQLLVERA
jgi:hypothetical protein